MPLIFLVNLTIWNIKVIINCVLVNVLVIGDAKQLGEVYVASRELSAVPVYR